MEDLSGKSALITGGAGGLGAAAAELFIQAGARVVISDIAEERGRALASKLGRAAVFRRHDVSNADEWTHTVAAAEQAFGPVSILVNNAAMTIRTAPADSCTEADYRRMFEVNQLSVFLGMRAVVPTMRKLGGGAIVNVSSVAGLAAAKGALAYVATKFAVTGMTKVAALDFGADNIRVNSVHPGVIDTPMIQSETPITGPNPVMEFCKTLPIPRPAAPVEVARVILFLASDSASFCTGAAFSADGGWTL
jgi:3alpha(or 20beta)-hydroxysteroid dehydrogenase